MFSYFYGVITPDFGKTILWVCNEIMKIKL